MYFSFTTKGLKQHCQVHFHTVVLFSYAFHKVAFAWNKGFYEHQMMLFPGPCTFLMRCVTKCDTAEVVQRCCGFIDTLFLITLSLLAQHISVTLGCFLTHSSYARIVIAFGSSYKNLKLLSLFNKAVKRAKMLCKKQWSIVMSQISSVIVLWQSLQRKK